MKTKRKTAFMIGILTASILFAGCAKKPQATQNDEVTPVVKDTESKSNGAVQQALPLSEFLKQENPLIFYRVTAMDKEARPDIFVFDNGTLTRFQNGYYGPHDAPINHVENSIESIKFGELSKMTDEEIIEKLTEMNVAIMEDLVKSAKLKAMPESIDGGQAQPYTDEEREEASEFVKTWEGRESEYPSADPYLLNVQTDPSGNITTEEIIASAGGPGITVKSFQAAGSIYDSNYGGLTSGGDSMFVMRLDGNFPGITLDTPETEGIDVDGFSAESQKILDKNRFISQ